MKHTRITSSLLIFFLAGVVPLSAAVDVETLGKQKARIFKTIKCDFLVKTNNNFGNPKKKITKIISFFEEDQTKLLNSTQDPKELEALQAIKSEWEKLKQQFGKPVNDQEIERAFKEEFRQGMSAKKLVLELTEKQLQNKQNKDLFYLNNLRAISQKFAITYLIKSVEPANAVSDETKKQLAITLKKFRTALEYLHQTLQTDTQKAMLAELEKIYRFFDFLSRSKLLTPTLIVQKSNEMLSLSRKLIKDYHSGN